MSFAAQKTGRVNAPPLQFGVGGVPYLDHAKVPEYTDWGHYGYVIEYDENYISHHKELCYLAIAQYDGDDYFYLFGCDADFEVISDSLHDSPKECKSVSCYVSEDTVWYKK